jgi:hypothetical protein
MRDVKNHTFYNANNKVIKISTSPVCTGWWNKVQKDFLKLILIFIKIHKNWTKISNGRKLGLSNPLEIVYLSKDTHVRWVDCF